MKKVDCILLIVTVITLTFPVNIHSREIVDVRNVKLAPILKNIIEENVIPVMDSKNLDPNKSYIFLSIKLSTEDSDSSTNGIGKYYIDIAEYCNEGRIEENPVGYTFIGKYIVIVHASIPELWQLNEDGVVRQFETYDLLDVLGCESSQWFYYIDDSASEILDQFINIFP